MQTEKRVLRLVAEQLAEIMLLNKELENAEEIFGRLAAQLPDRRIKK